MPIAGTAVAVVIAVAALAVFSMTGSSPTAPAGGSAAQSDVAKLAGLDQAATLAVGSGGVPNPLHSTGHAPQNAGGPVRFTYVGAEFCPYCAAERWSIVIALSRFGTLGGVQRTTSAGDDIYPNTPTFTFAHATFTSSSVTFDSAETEDRSHNPLQQPSAAAQAAMSAHDSANSIPFIDVAGGQYELGSGYLPDTITGQSWAQVLAEVQNYNSPAAQQIIGNANWLTAALCKDGASSSACSSPQIKALEGRLG